MLRLFCGRLFRYQNSTILLQRAPQSSLASQNAEDGDEESLKTKTVKKRKVVECPENSKLMRVSIIGVPNAGKSTIINTLTEFQACPVSHRPHTTRKNQKAVYLDENTQLVLVDTPGLVSIKEVKKFAFTDEFVFGPERSIGLSHVVAVIHDVSNRITREKLDFRIKRVLEKFPDKKSILILNKVDQIKHKHTLLDIVKYLTSGIVGGQPLPVTTFEEKKKQSHQRLDTESILSKAKERHRKNEDEKKERELGSDERNLAVATRLFSDAEIKKGIHQLGWPKFHDIFMVSALKGDGIEMLRRYLIVNAVPDQWIFEKDTLTDIAPDQLAIQTLKAKLLDHLPQEIPFAVKPKLEYFIEESGEIKVAIKIRCNKERYVSKVRGFEDSRIKLIEKETLAILHNLLCCPITLTLNVEYDKTLDTKK